MEGFDCIFMNEYQRDLFQTSRGGRLLLLLLFVLAITVRVRRVYTILESYMV